MRKLLVVLIVLLVVLAGVVVLAAMNLDRFVNANRDALAQRVESAVGRKVSFGEVGISFAGGLGVRVADLAVGEDPAFATGGEAEFLRADAVDVRVSLLQALFGKIEVSRVILRAPRITVIKTAKGLSTDSLGGGGGGAPQAPAEPGAKSSRELQVSLVDVRDGELRFVDRTVKPPATFEVKALDVRIPSYRPGAPVKLEVSAAVAGAGSQNLEVSGTVGPMEASNPQVDLSVQLDPLEIAELTRLSLLPAELSGSGPVALEAELKGTLEALDVTARLDAGRAALRYGEGFEKAAGVDLDLDLAAARKGSDLTVERALLRLGDTELHAKATVKNLEKPKLDFTASSPELRPHAFGVGEPDDVLADVEATGSFTFPAAGPAGKATLSSPEGVYSKAPYRNLKLVAVLGGGRVDIQSLTADAFKGKLVARGTYDTSRSAFDVDTEVSEMRIEDLLATRSKAAAALLSGTLGGKLDLRGHGSAWEEIKRVLTGDGEIRITDGAIGKFNPARKAFAALALLPNFKGGGLARFIDSHPKVFGAEEAPFEKMSGQLAIRDGWLQLRDFVLAAQEYDLLGKGRYSLDGELDLNALMAMSKQLSEELLASEPTLRYLRDSTGRVELPLALRGTPPKVAVVPDVSKIAASAGREALTDALTGALGGKRKTEPAAGESQAPASEKRRDALSEALGGVLGTPPPAEAPAPEAKAPAEEPAPEPAATPEATTPPEPAPAPTPEEAGAELLRKGVEGLLRGGEKP